jgi:hypothetical protein
MVCHSDTLQHRTAIQNLSQNIRILLVILPLIVMDMPWKTSGWLFETRAE